jgi:hypothetical protein
MNAELHSPLEINTGPIPVQLAYATPAPGAGSPVAAGVWITLAGLALIFLGGCFLIGVMLCSFNRGGSSEFVILLYVLAFLCFAAASCVLFLGIRKLLAVGRDR